MNTHTYIDESRLCCLGLQDAKERLAGAPQETTLNDTADLFKVLGDRTRVRILSFLRQGPLCVNDLSALLDMHQTAVSHQLKVLRHNRLVGYEKAGKMAIYRLSDSHIEALFDMASEHVGEALPV